MLKESKSNEALRVKAYLRNYEDKFNEIESFITLENAYQKYISLCNEFEKIYIMKFENLFEQIAKLLEIEAQLQLLLVWFGSSDWKVFSNEEKILEYIESDKNCYYRELVDTSLTEIPKGIIYLSEKNNNI